MNDYSIVKTINLDDDTRLVVHYDDDYQIEAVERELTPEQVEEERAQIEREGVYGVVLQRRQRWVLMGSPEEVIREDWEDEESIWGCFLDNTYTAETVAEEFWGVKRPTEQKEN